jgi:Ion transport protein
MLARGYILGPFHYLRDAWNWLDFIVVSLAYVDQSLAVVFASSGVFPSAASIHLFGAFSTVTPTHLSSVYLLIGLAVISPRNMLPSPKMKSFPVVQLNC